jgi:hypothetical protein
LLQTPDLEWILDNICAQEGPTRRLVSQRHWRALRAERRRKRTLLEWLRKKDLISANEFLAGQALAVLIDWRASKMFPGSSSVSCARKMLEGPPGVVPIEVQLLVRNSDDDGAFESGTVIDVDEFRLGKAVTHKGKRTGLSVFNDTIRERLNEAECAHYELMRVDSLLRRALPERPDLSIILGHCVTERIRVNQIPHHDVELLCAGLHVVKELWRYDLLEDAINEATGLRHNRSIRRARSDQEYTQSICIPRRPSRQAEDTWDTDCQADAPAG